jgi:predicted CXXCH cytochrome family protein
MHKSYQRTALDNECGAIRVQTFRRADMGWNDWFGQAGGGRRLVIGFAVALVAAATSIPASAGIAATKHNLGSSGAAPSNVIVTAPNGTTSTVTITPNQFSGTAEICVFCHTPHGADTSAAVPLWNRTLSAATNYTTYDTLGTSTLDGKVAPVGSVSIACLSCHDGVTSMSAVINAPGSGLAGDAAWKAGTWTGDNQAGGLMTGVAKLGTDLTNDHPIGIQYGGGGITLAAPGHATNDPDFRATANMQTANGASRVWWVDTTAPNSSLGTRQKTDMMLYTRTVATAAGVPEPFVECASCHDPHTSDNPTFLRISNAGSAVCLACHIK